MCTLDKRGNLFVLTLTGDDEHRLNPTLIDSIRDALDRVRSGSTGAAALITTAHGKFFSNGYDLRWALSDPDPVQSEAFARPKAMSAKFRLLIADLISLPMPTIAAVTGHASAAGFGLALSHDYLLMSRGRGFLYMSELDIGYKIPNFLFALVKARVGPPRSWRNVVLRAEKITAETGVEWGIVDSAHASAGETLEAALRLGGDLAGRNWDGKVYADCRRTVLADVVAALGSDETVGDAGEGTAAVSRLNAVELDRNDSVHLSLDKKEDESEVKNDEKVESEQISKVIVDEKVDSIKKNDSSVLSGDQPKVVVKEDEEEDLGWDEIEDIGSGDEEKVSSTAQSCSPSRTELKKQLIAGKDDEDLSWDIDDDDDEPVKRPCRLSKFDKLVW
ncbi:Enoyl-CoA delta isomerase 1- peroxisomal [Striga hermonthica]|uniref:Delta(3)-Delta(2)-enoyl-CoA isomerase n=1 Tax=Striga hermonthica TaxID=68872 RepID=A0A9N7RIF3_STRHE|nr:Enoyl-CoA delta isomerase 1- peroxisomal [Striga hermonthica]